MKKTLRMIGLVGKDILTSGFTKMVGLVIGVLVLGWLLFVPSVMLLDIYRQTPVLSIMVEPNEDFPEASLFDHVTEEGNLEKKTYEEVFIMSYEEWYYIPLLGVVGILCVFLCLTPLWILLIGLLFLLVFACGVVIVFNFFRDLPYIIKRYIIRLKERVDEREDN